MPKRKAPEPADAGSSVAGVGEKLTLSLNPHKKSKQEALTAARDWHDSLNKSGVGGGGASPAAAKAGAGAGEIAAVQQRAATHARSQEKECAVAASSAAAATSAGPAAKKSKKEALAAAREWHDSRAKSGAVVVGASPAAVKAGSGDCKIAAVQQRSATSARKEFAAAATSAASARQMPENVISTQSPLYRDAKPTKTDGGPGDGNNAFLKSVRTEKGTALKSKNDESSSKSTNIESPPLTAPSMTASKKSSSRVALGHMDTTAKRKNIGIFGKSLLFLSLFALNISMAIVAIVVIKDLSSSLDELRERHVSEVKELVTRLSTSREVEALLRSGIHVLEQEIVQAKRMNDSADARAMYGIRTDPRIEADDDLLQSLEEKDDWLQGIRALEVEKSRGLENLNAKRIALLVASRVWSEEGDANRRAEVCDRQGRAIT
jgi:hypothetical protein